MFVCLFVFLFSLCQGLASWPAWIPISNWGRCVFPANLSELAALASRGTRQDSLGTLAYTPNRFQKCDITRGFYPKICWIFIRKGVEGCSKFSSGTWPCKGSCADESIHLQNMLFRPLITLVVLKAERGRLCDNRTSGGCVNTFGCSHFAEHIALIGDQVADQLRLTWRSLTSFRRHNCGWRKTDQLGPVAQYCGAGPADSLFQKLKITFFFPFTFFFLMSFPL